MPLLKKICFSALFMSFVVGLLFTNLAYGQQSNIQTSTFPIVDPDFEARETEGKFSLIYHRMTSDEFKFNGLDVNYVYRKSISDAKASNFTVGSTLLGGLLGGEMYIDNIKDDAGGIIIHGSYNLEYQVRKTSATSLILFWGLPVSGGNFYYEFGEGVEMYNLIAGLQGGAQLGIKAGDFKIAPLGRVQLLVGYVERYRGGVYYENLRTGGIPPFVTISYGLEIFYPPFDLALSIIEQKTLESWENVWIDTTMIQLGLLF